MNNLEKLQSETNRRLKEGFKSLCCKLSNNNKDRELFMACEPITGDPIIVTYGFTGDTLAITYTNIDGTPYVGNAPIKCPDTDYELTNFQWFCLNGTSQISRTDLYLNGVFQSYIWQNISGTIITAPVVGTYIIGDCRTEYNYLPGTVVKASKLSMTTFDIDDFYDGNITIDWAINTALMQGDSLSSATLVLNNGSQIVLTGNSGTYYDNITIGTSLPQDIYTYKIVLHTNAGFKAVYTRTLNRGFSINTKSDSLCTNSNILDTLDPQNYYIIVKRALIGYNRYGVLLGYYDSTDPSTIFTMTDNFIPSTNLDFNDSDCFDSVIPIKKQWNYPEHELVSNAIKTIATNTVHSVTYTVISVPVTVTINGVSAAPPTGIPITIEASNLINGQISFNAGGVAAKVYVTTIK